VVALHVDGKQLLTADSVPEGFPMLEVMRVLQTEIGEDIRAIGPGATP
jgi:hypothetical protein